MSESAKNMWVTISNKMTLRQHKQGWMIFLTVKALVMIEISLKKYQEACYSEVCINTGNGYNIQIT